ncbi:MAG: hypothetical protein COA52_01150 [Hyphomicrobiales bacterium]|nr:MAG: hypothetical protein COA52_00060 [Hyphomicrobiales bacterium]PCJ96844.1 MAG: hypothetical protein COA52_01150 [Hyphomicrobiales bacterium]
MYSCDVFFEELQKINDNICVLTLSVEFNLDNNRIYSYKAFRRKIKLRKLFLEQRGLCYCCAKQMKAVTKRQKHDSVTFEHIICKKDGGTLDSSNIVLNCNSCNNQRKTENFFTFLSKKRKRVFGNVILLEEIYKFLNKPKIRNYFLIKP